MGRGDSTESVLDNEQAEQLLLAALRERSSSPIVVDHEAQKRMQIELIEQKVSDKDTLQTEVDEVLIRISDQVAERAIPFASSADDYRPISYLTQLLNTAHAKGLISKSSALADLQEAYRSISGLSLINFEPEHTEASGKRVYTVPESYINEEPVLAAFHALTNFRLKVADVQLREEDLQQVISDAAEKGWENGYITPLYPRTAYLSAAKRATAQIGPLMNSDTGDQIKEKMVELDFVFELDDLSPSRRHQEVVYLNIATALDEAAPEVNWRRALPADMWAQLIDNSVVLSDPTQTRENLRRNYSKFVLASVQRLSEGRVSEQLLRAQLQAQAFAYTSVQGRPQDAKARVKNRPLVS